VVGVRYVPAKWQKNRRFGYKIELIVLHAMQASETSKTAESCAQVFQRGTRQASAHYCCDNDSIVQAVPDLKYAYGAGGGIGVRRINDNAIHIEHAGFSEQSLAQWSDDFSQKMLFWSALHCAGLSVKYGIHSTFRDVADLRAGNWNGYTTHATVEKAFPTTGHWDPGPNFPLMGYLATVAYWIPKVKV
jgi:hypothetical protein